MHVLAEIHCRCCQKQSFHKAMIHNRPRSQCSCRTSVCIEKTPKGSILSHHLLHLLHMMPTAKGYLLPNDWILSMNGVIRFDSCGQADPLLWIFAGLGQQEACLKISRPLKNSQVFSYSTLELHVSGTHTKAQMYTVYIHMLTNIIIVYT